MSAKPPYPTDNGLPVFRPRIESDGTPWGTIVRELNTDQVLKCYNVTWELRQMDVNWWWPNGEFGTPDPMFSFYTVKAECELDVLINTPQTHLQLLRHTAVYDASQQDNSRTQVAEVDHPQRKSSPLLVQQPRPRQRKHYGPLEGRTDMAPVLHKPEIMPVRLTYDNNALQVLNAAGQRAVNALSAKWEVDYNPLYPEDDKRSGPLIACIIAYTDLGAAARATLPADCWILE